MEKQRMFTVFVTVLISVLITFSSGGAYSRIEVAQSYEQCVIGSLSKATSFTELEKVNFSKLVKENGIRMHKLQADPTSASTTRTMLRLFVASLANLVSIPKDSRRFERKIKCIASLVNCSGILTKSMGSELVDETKKIFELIEKEKTSNYKNVSNKSESSHRKENVLELKQGYGSSGLRQKRAAFPPVVGPQFQFDQPLEGAIADILMNSQTFANTFKSGSNKQEVLYYSKGMAEAGLEGYSFNIIQEAVNSVQNAVSRMMLLSQTADYASAISTCIASVLRSHELAFFADGIGIGNSLLTKLEVMKKTNAPVSPLQTNLNPGLIEGGVIAPQNVQANIRQEALASSISTADSQISGFQSSPDFTPVFPTSNVRPYSRFENYPPANQQRFSTGNSSPVNPSISSAQYSPDFYQPAERQRNLGQLTTEFKQTNPANFDSSQPALFPSTNFQTLQRTEVSGQSMLPIGQQTQSISNRFGPQPLIFPSPVEQPATSFQPGQSNVNTELSYIDPKAIDVSTAVFNTLEVSDSFASIFNMETSKDDAASVAALITSTALSLHDPTAATDIESQVWEAVYNSPSNSGTMDYLQCFTDTLVKSLGEHGLLDNINTRLLAGSLLGAINSEASRRQAEADASTRLRETVPTKPELVFPVPSPVVLPQQFQIPLSNFESASSNPAAESPDDAFEQQSSQTEFVPSGNFETIPTSFSETSKMDDYSSASEETKLNGTLLSAQLSPIEPMQTVSNSQQVGVENNPSKIGNTNGDGLISEFATETTPSKNSQGSIEEEPKIPNFDIFDGMTALEVNQTPVETRQPEPENKQLDEFDSVVSTFGSFQDPSALASETLPDITETKSSKVQRTTPLAAETETSSLADNPSTTAMSSTATTATPTSFDSSLADILEDPAKISEYLRGELSESLRAINVTDAIESKPGTPDSATVGASSISTSTKKKDSATTISNGTDVVLQPSFGSTTTDASETVAPDDSEEESAVEKTFEELKMGKPNLLFAQEILSIATSSISYIRSGDYKLSDMCDRLNDFAMIVEISPVPEGNCKEDALIDFLLHVLKETTLTLRG